MNMKTKFEMREYNKALIEKVIKNNLTEINYDSVSNLISKMLVSRQLALSSEAYTPADIKNPNGVGRYLIYSNEDEENPVSIWAFSFAPGQKTAIHSHKYKGTVIVVQGIVIEKFYLLMEDGGVKSFVRNVREAPNANQDDLKKGIIHRLGNQNKKYNKEEGQEGSQDESKNAVTVHVYNMLGRKKNQSEDNRNLNRLFTKTPLAKKPLTVDSEDSRSPQRSKL